jgi:GNAT superfamily N-acetyltransferase
VPVDRPAPGGSSLDAATVRFLLRHEALASAVVRREVRDLDDAILVYDDLDPDPFWTRLAAIRWPDDGDAFDRRLAEAFALFAGLDRRPHLWPTPPFDTPADLVERLVGAGFEDVGAGMLMVHDDSIGAVAADGEAMGTGRLDAGITVDRHHLEPPDVARIVSDDASVVLADAFGLDSVSDRAVSADTAASLAHPSVHLTIARVDGEAAAVGKRTTFDGASYLSSIGTRAEFRGRGLGRLVTETLVRDAVAEGSRWTHLGVFAENHAARRLYERLGFVAVGPPAPDMLLRA